MALRRSVGLCFLSRSAASLAPDPGGHVVISGQLRLKNHAGILDLRTEFDTPLVAEVVCRKINYLNEFQTLLNKVAEQLAELLLQYDSPVSFSFDAGDFGSENEAALLFQMRHIMSPAESSCRCGRSFGCLSRADDQSNQEPKR